MDAFRKSLTETYQDLCDYAALKDISLILRQAISRTPWTLEDLQKLVTEVNRSNFYLAPSMALLMADEEHLEDHLNILGSSGIKYLIISATEKDIHDQIWNINIPLYRSSKKETVREILKKLPDACFIMDGLYSSYDEEYMDCRELDLMLEKN